jgi:hypothetical protein
MQSRHIWTIYSLYSFLIIYSSDKNGSGGYSIFFVRILHSNGLSETISVLSIYCAIYDIQHKLSDYFTIILKKNDDQLFDCIENIIKLLN